MKTRRKPVLFAKCVLVCQQTARCHGGADGVSKDRNGALTVGFKDLLGGVSVFGDRDVVARFSAVANRPQPIGQDRVSALSGLFLNQDLSFGRQGMLNEFHKQFLSVI